MKKTDAVLISSPANIKYLTKYFNFSENEREAFIIQLKNKFFLITDRRYSSFLQKKIKNMSVLDVGATNFLKNDVKEFFNIYKINKIGFEEYDLTYEEFKLLKKYAKPIPTELRRIREIKNTDEIKHIKKACRIGDEAFEFILKKINVGVTENEIANEFINFFRTNNADFSFRPIVAFGENSAIPHHDTSNRKLKNNQIVLMDFGVKVNGYCSDMTRTIFFGKADNKFIKIYNTTIEAQKEATNNIKPNTQASNVDKAARRHIRNKGYGEIIHAVGHGIGIEVHEPPTISPNSKEKLKNGIVFSIEPGIYEKNYGGVRIEDLFYLKNNKPVSLTKASKQLIEIK